MTQAIDAVSRKPLAPSSDVRPVTEQKKVPTATRAETSQTTVSLSRAALLAAAKEAAETPAQTAKEARSNDRQAQRLLAHETAAHATK